MAQRVVFWVKLVARGVLAVVAVVVCQPILEDKDAFVASCVSIS